MAVLRFLLGKVTGQRGRGEEEKEKKTGTDGFEAEQLLAAKRAEEKLKEYAANREARKRNHCLECGAAISAESYARGHGLCGRCTQAQYGHLDQEPYSLQPNGAIMFGFKRKKGKEEQKRDLVSEYATVLEKGGEAPLRPESSLPAPKEQIKKAMLAEAIVLSRDAEANSDYLETLCTCYGLLSDFVEDELAEKAQRFFQIMKATPDLRELPPDEADKFLKRFKDAGYPGDAMKRRIEEFARLTAEFRKVVAAARQSWKRTPG